MLNFKKSYKLPFKYEIPHYIEHFLKSRNFFKIWIKYFKRYLFIFLNGQKKLELFSILPEHQNILWINISAPSLGDSLMDLSSRVLLEGKNIDLFTVDNIADLYANDRRFKNVYSSVEIVSKNKYNLVIVDSYSSRSIKVKCKIAPRVNFIGMFCYFNGPDVNRILYSFHQMNNLLGYKYSESEINKKAKSSMLISTHDKNIIDSFKLPKKFIAIALGGEWEYRTYNNWGKVINKLLTLDNNLKLILIGSDNAKESEKEILEHYSTPSIQSYVAKLTFNQSAQIINKAEILFCCDGGLMHAANSFDTINISLFARLHAEMRLTKSCRVLSLCDLNDVNNISAEDIILKYIEATNLDHNHPLVE